MTYNRETQAYEATALLKQGYYNYNYLFVPDGETQGNSGRTDGNFYETETNTSSWYTIVLTEGVMTNWSVTAA